MTVSFDVGFQKNRNPLVKAVLLDIMRVIYRDDKAKILRDRVMEMCLDDLHLEAKFTVGWQWYLEKAVEMVLETDVGENTLELLLRHSSEEVVMKALSWANDSGASSILSENIRDALWDLINQNKWDGVCSLSLRAMSNAVDGETQVTLAHCLRGYQNSNHLRIKDGWIALAGYAARMVFIILNLF
jgi:hypothetical protein